MVLPQATFFVSSGDNVMAGNFRCFGQMTSMPTSCHLKQSDQVACDYNSMLALTPSSISNHPTGWDNSPLITGLLYN